MEGAAGDDTGGFGMFSASVNIIGVSAYRNRKVAIDLDCLEPSKATELPNATTIMRRDRRGAGEGDIKSPIAVPQRPCSDQRERLRDFVRVFRRGGAKDKHVRRNARAPFWNEFQAGAAVGREDKTDVFIERKLSYANWAGFQEGRTSQPLQPS